MRSRTRKLLVQLFELPFQLARAVAIDFDDPRLNSERG